jgi:RNA polymerase sigma-70 factor (ECF subfamily)
MEQGDMEQGDMEQGDMEQPEQLEAVLELFSKYQRRLYAYIFAILANHGDAEEVLQRTNIVVWRKFNQFRLGTDFRAWVFRIAFFEARKYLAEKRRASGFMLSDEVLEMLAQTYHDQEKALKRRSEALDDCLEKLPSNDRRLIDKIYGEETPVGQYAERVGRQPTSVYRSLRRIRQALFDCLELAMAGRKYA